MKAVFVHLSDIHFGQERDGGRDALNADAKQQLIADAGIEISKLGVKATGVIVTGDIAYSAQDHQYAMAGKWLAELTSAIGCDQTDVQLVPGNHDIDRKKITNSIESVLYSIREGGDRWLDMHLDSPQDCDRLYDRFDAYKGFALDYRCELDLNGGISTSAKLELAEGRAIRFVRLNTALICSSSDDEGKLILGARQRILPTEDGVEIVVLAHHPLNWFQDSDKARGFLRGRARVFISGHEHFPSLDVVRVEDGCDLMMLAAGATAPDEINGPFTYKYNILTFEWDEAQDALAVTINPRTWNAEMARFERDDVFMEGHAERQVLASPFFRKAPKPPNIDPAKLSVPELIEESSEETIQTDMNEESGIVLISEQLATIEATPPSEPQPTQDIRDLQIRFFQELSEAQRGAAFIAFGVVTQLKGRIDHGMERRLFRRAVRQGKADDIEQMLNAAKTEKGGATL
ncbi:metallophosphoesterase [Novacetimonas sp. GS1]|uniref:metallophosphoesterase n=1 Tax=Novacetimonas sp. GS1 TaxID=3119990 RepID=UPI002FCCFAC1